MVEAAKIYEADFQADSVAANEAVQVKIRTNLAAAKVGVQNENGKWITSKIVGEPEVVENEKVWTVELSVGTAGMRILSFVAADANGEWAPVSVQDSIIIK